MMENPAIEKVNWDDFYSKLSYLFYGILAASGPVDADNMELLKKIVSRLWTRHADNLTGFQGYMVNRTESVFDWLQLNDTDWEYSVNEFAYFMNRNRDNIPSEMKQFIRDAAGEILALTSHGVNPVMDRLDELID